MDGKPRELAVISLSEKRRAAQPPHWVSELPDELAAQPHNFIVCQKPRRAPTYVGDGAPLSRRCVPCAGVAPAWLSPGTVAQIDDPAGETALIREVEPGTNSGREDGSPAADHHGRHEHLVLIHKTGP